MIINLKIIAGAGVILTSDFAEVKASRFFIACQAVGRNKGSKEMLRMEIALSISSNSITSSVCSCGVQVAGCLPFGRYRMMIKMENISANCRLCRMPPISSSPGHVIALLQDWSTSGAAHGREKMRARNLDPSGAAESPDVSG